MAANKIREARDLMPFSGAAGVPEWVIRMGNEMGKHSTEIRSGQWVVTRDDPTQPREYLLIVARERL